MYQHYQLIGYQTPTVQPLDPGALVNLDDYANVLGDFKQNDQWLPTIENEDLKKRLARLLGVVEKARAQQELAVSNLATTLKVFLVPEFYFRPKGQGVQNSYSSADRDALVKVLDQYVKAARFQHWLFVFGTVIWQTQVNQIFADANLPEEVRIKDQEAQKYVIKNTTLVGQGGTKLTTFDKVEYSPIDAIDQQYWAYYKDGLTTNLDKAFDIIIKDPDNKMKWIDKKKAKEGLSNAIKAYIGQGMTNRLNGIVKFNNTINVGIEVCLDHEKKFIYEALTDYRKSNNDANFALDMQLLVSCGMAVHPDKLQIAPGRVILRNDGQVELDEKPRKRVEAARVISGVGQQGGLDPKRVVAGYPDVNGLDEPDDDPQYKADNTIAWEIALDDSYKFPPLADKFDIKKHNQGEANGKQTTMDVQHPQKLIVFKSCSATGV